MESAPLSILIAHCYQAPFLKRNIRCWELVSPQIWKEAHTIGKGWCELHEGPLCSLGRGPQSMDYLAFLNTISAKAFLCFLTIHLLQLYSFTLGFLVLFLPYPRVQSHKVMGKGSEDACNRLCYRKGSISLKSINFLGWVGIMSNLHFRETCYPCLPLLNAIQTSLKRWFRTNSSWCIICKVHRSKGNYEEFCPQTATCK